MGQYALSADRDRERTDLFGERTCYTGNHWRGVLTSVGAKFFAIGISYWLRNWAFRADGLYPSQFSLRA
jgi:hypothetical protein